LTGDAVIFGWMASRKNVSKKAPASKAGRAPVAPTEGGRNWLVRSIVWVYLSSAATVGWLARSLASEKLAKEDRRDGPPFALFLLVVIGVVVVWFLNGNDIARLINTTPELVLAGCFFSLASQAFSIWPAHIHNLRMELKF